MNVTIYYCNLCKLRKPAESIASALRSELDVVAEIREGFWGTFRIGADGREIFNRWKTHGIWGRLGFGRTPSPGEIVAAVREIQSTLQTEDSGRQALAERCGE